MNAAQNNGDGGGGLAGGIGALILIGLLIGIYYAVKNKKPKDDGDGEDTGAAGPVVGGGLSQTENRYIPPAVFVDPTGTRPFTNSWAAIIDVIGSLFLDQLKDALEEKIKKAEEDKARADEDKAKADAEKAQADADKAKADADKAKADADKAKADADKAKADADKAQADADKARANADARAEIDADKARAEGKVVDSANRTVEALDAEQAQADADKAKADADRAAADADRAAADADKARADADKAAADADKARADADAKSAIVAEFETAKAGEEGFMRDNAADAARRGDPKPGGRALVPEARAAMTDKVQSLEEGPRRGADAKARAGDLVDEVKREMDKGRMQAELDTQKKTDAKATQFDTDAENEARAKAEAESKAAADAKARADADAEAKARTESRSALDLEAKSKAEGNVKQKAATVADTGRPLKPSPAALDAAHRSRAPNAAADTTRIVEMGEPKVDEKTGLLDPETADPNGDLRTHPLDYNGPRMASFGKMPSTTMKGARKFISKVTGDLLRRMATQPTTQLGASQKAYLDSAINERGAGKAAAKIAGKSLIQLIGKLDMLSDRLMVVQVLCDSFFYNAFPDESQLITDKVITGIQYKSLKAQIDSTSKYNKDVVDPTNAGMSNYAYARAQWPIFVGPLDDPLQHTSRTTMPFMRYPEYENQQRVQAEVDSVREKLLRSDTELVGGTGTSASMTFKAYWISKFSRSVYDDVIADRNDSLTNYVETETFANTVSDNLYRKAYTAVCLYHGGKVYEDVRATDTTKWSGRPRFQCSWPTKERCENAGDTWLENNGQYGNYAEWYTFDELNTSLSAIADPTASDPAITACAGTDKTTYRKACGIESTHPLRRGGNVSGCIISNASVASICKTNKGVYNKNGDHRCEFSPDYCQSIGTCYDQTTKTCFLPGEAMFAVSMVFGTGGPREWIKVHGCNFASTPEKAFTDIIGLTPFGLFTKEGQTFMADMIANNENWSEGLKVTLGNPVMIATIASMVVVYGLGASGATVAVVAAAAPGLAAGGLAAGAAAGGIGLLVMAVAIGIAIGVMQLESQEDQNKGPPDPEYGPYASEYTVGGWKDNIGTSLPMTLGFNDGWVTKPLKAHSTTNWPQTLATTPTAARTTGSAVPVPIPLNSVRDMPGAAPVDRFFAVYDLDGAWRSGFDMALAVKTYTQTKEPPVRKKLCYQTNKIRSGANPSQNELHCMDPFPPAEYTDTINIGTLAPGPNLAVDGTSRAYTTSKTWTDGVDPSTPQYPFGCVSVNDPNLWYYQLSYDKHNMVGMTSNIASDGTPYKKGYPSVLWNTDLLRYYFLDTTIQEMRQYYCLQALIDVPEGTWNESASPPGVHPKCWGFLNVKFPGYNYMPMTIPGEMMSSARPALTDLPTGSGGGPPVGQVVLNAPASTDTWALSMPGSQGGAMQGYGGR